MLIFYLFIFKRFSLFLAIASAQWYFIGKLLKAVFKSIHGLLQFLLINNWKMAKLKKSGGVSNYKVLDAKRERGLTSVKRNSRINMGLRQSLAEKHTSVPKTSPSSSERQDL